MYTQMESYQELIQHIRWVIRLRWLAVAGLLVMASLFHWLSPSDFKVMGGIALVVVAYSALAQLHGRAVIGRGGLKWPGELNLALNLQFALDMLVLALVIHLTGGVESFLIPVYLVLVPAARRVLSRRATFLQASLVVVLLGVLFWLEFTGRLAHRVMGPGSELYANAAYLAQVLIFQACFLYLGVYIADRLHARLRRSLEAEWQAQYLALTDSLTGLYNRRHLQRVLEQELARSQRHGHSLAVLMLDLDNFKQYNDRYGHLAGDEALRHLAELIGGVVRESDTAFRYGGEEFVLVLPEARERPALLLAERLRQVVEAHRFVVRGDADVGRITISGGVATYPEDAGDVEGLIHAADMALLRAKQRKNRVCMHSAWKRPYSLRPMGANAMRVLCLEATVANQLNELS